jgi:hypothetical protein
VYSDKKPVSQQLELVKQMQEVLRNQTKILNELDWIKKAQTTHDNLIAKLTKVRTSYPKGILSKEHLV